MELYEPLYQEMLAAIAACQDQGLAPRAEIECCHRVALNYMARVEQGTAVSFFKHTWPRFLAESRYYELRYLEVLFRPTGSVQQLKHFWVRESGRLQRKTREYPELYAYYQFGAMYRDAEWFGGDINTANQHARILAEFMALARYGDYLEQVFTAFFNHLPE